MTTDFERYFLDAVDSDDLFFRAPRRLGCNVEPLIDRAQAFQAMEREVVGATASVHLAGWVFFPDTPLLDAGVKKTTGGRTWLDLIRHVVTKAQPATVRVIVTDFDPFFEPRNHRLCWSALSTLVRLRSRLPLDRRELLQCVGSLHEYFITPGLITLGLFSVEDQIKTVVAEYNAMAFAKAQKLFARSPGHWGSITASPRKRFALSSSLETRAFIASHHQKVCLVDGRVGFCGGMDLTPLALDDHNHKRRRHPFKRGEFDLSWHDLQARVEGQVVDDLERNFRERWNLEMFTFVARLNLFATQAPTGAALPILAPAPIPAPASVAGPATRPGKSVAQALRTVSVNGSQFLPELKRADVLEAYTAAIGAASRYIYLENQYFRSTELVDRIIARHEQNPRLQVILVIPIAPEELTSPESADPKALHPIAVQIEQIERLRAALGPNLGVFSLVARARSVKPRFTDAFKSPQIYVHSKMCIVDDEFATIGSANVNGRSFRMDTELNIAWFDPSAVLKLRLQLWKHLLGSHAGDVARWDASSFVVRWKGAAALNAVQPPETRGGLVIPHDNDALADVAKPMALVPEVFIDIEDTLPERAPADLVELDEARGTGAPAVG